MLQEAIDLQQNAVAELMAKIGTKRELTFRAPTGSGKTRMMADFMNRVLSQNQDVIFLVSTLSKGNLAEQNYNEFKECADKNIFQKLKPHLISSEISGEEQLCIPLDYNVYVLPRDLYKLGGRLMQGAMLNFLEQVTTNLFGIGLNKKIYLIKDECHQATKNLDNISESYFEKVINFSATPKIKRKQHPDVEITDEAAMNAKLIKHIEWGAAEDDVETAIRKFEQIKEGYRNLLNRNPCLIIQISNKNKAEEEWAKIESVLNKTEHQGLKWMTIVDNHKKCKTNDKFCTLPVERWKDYAKPNASTIDIIVFKMVISEGWDIPRACMLYQVRDTKSKQLDEQVMGRVRRNPRLNDFEKLTPEAQNLAMTAWIWGIEPKKGNNSRQVRLFGSENDIPQAIKIKTTYLKQLTERKDFDIDKFINEKSKHDDHQPNSIFELYAKLQKAENELRNLCFEYADNYQKWWHFCEHIDAVRKEYDNFACNYEESMDIVKDADGNDREVSFPLTSMYVDNEANKQYISDWVWQRKDGSNKFSFDSDAEHEWASFLKDIATYCESIEVGEINPHYGQLRTDGTVEPQRINAEPKFLWGKNFIQNSEIKFEYYQNGIHASYPDFVLKDKKGRIHIFEVKGEDESNSTNFNRDEYNDKIVALIECYKQCSVLTGYIYYVPVRKNGNWTINRIVSGEKSIITKDEFKRGLNAD